MTLHCACWLSPRKPAGIFEDLWTRVKIQESSDRICEVALLLSLLYRDVFETVEIFRMGQLVTGF